METEFYRSPTELLPTFSLILAASLGGINSLDRVNRAAIDRSHETVILPEPAQYAYYAPVAVALEASEQEEALRQFAKILLSKTEDNPQPVIDMLNQHFWDLV